MHPRNYSSSELIIMQLSSRHTISNTLNVQPQIFSSAAVSISTNRFIQFECNHGSEFRKYKRPIKIRERVCSLFDEIRRISLTKKHQEEQALQRGYHLSGSNKVITPVTYPTLI